MNDSSSTHDGYPAGSARGEVVGRVTELAAIDRFLEQLAHGPAALVFEGQAGIGKTTVWREVLGRASRGSIAVLSCRPVEAEAKLAFASLADLLEPVADTVLPQLPEPQRLALEVALMRASPRDAPPSARAVATAMLSALRVLAAGAPIVLAIDDQQWLDRASADALGFALRRLGQQRVGVAATTRSSGEGSGDRTGLDGALAGSVARIQLGPLGLSALHHVIRGHLGHVLARPALRRIADASGGNPFFALEIARSWIEAGAPAAAGGPLPVSDTLTSLVARRLGRLSARVRATLLVAAALSAPTTELIGQVIDRGEADAAIARAERARIVELKDGQVRFVHPLLASALYSSASPGERRALHARLAEVIAAPEERAHHLALAAARPDEVVACALDQAAVLAHRRGATDAAAELQERAASSTPLDDAPSIRARTIRAAGHFFHAGDRAHARALLERVLAERDATGRQRAEALHLLGRIRGMEDSMSDAVRLLAEALAHADDAATTVPIRLDLAFATFSAGDVSRAVEIGRVALTDAERLGDPGLVANALCVNVMGRFLSGLGTDHAALERALAMEDRSHAGQLLLRPSALAGQLAVYEGRLAEADTLLRELCSWATQRGEESELPFLLFHLARLECLRGDLAATARYAEDALMLAAQSDSETMRLFGLVYRAAARAGQGDVAAARADIAESRALIEKTGYIQGDFLLRGTEGALEMSLGDAKAAMRTLAPLVAMVEAIGLGEPSGAPYLPDAIEALIAVGEPDRAAVLLELLVRQANKLDRRWAIANAARCRSLLESARGDLDAGRAAAEEALARWQQLDMPIELGRTLLALGQVQRRRGERRAARDALERAREVFHTHGARLWAERAREELGRIPIRRGASRDLTATEAQVATLAAAGRTNHEIARALFVSHKTVEANLTRIYGKLGIRGRAELGVTLLERRDGEGPTKI